MHERRISELIVCDYCRYHKCSWTESGPGDTPSRCYEQTTFQVSDGYIDDDEFDRRVEIAKRIGSYKPDKGHWVFDPSKENALAGYDLKKTIDKEVNDWSEENELNLSDLVDYKEEGFEVLD